jgi:hypothetical protein
MNPHISRQYGPSVDLFSDLIATTPTEKITATIDLFKQAKDDINILVAVMITPAAEMAAAISNGMSPMDMSMAMSAEEAFDRALAHIERHPELFGPISEYVDRAVGSKIMLAFLIRRSQEMLAGPNNRSDKPKNYGRVRYKENIAYADFAIRILVEKVAEPGQVEQVFEKTKSSIADIRRAGYEIVPNITGQSLWCVARNSAQAEDIKYDFDEFVAGIEQLHRIINAMDHSPDATP